MRKLAFYPWGLIRMHNWSRLFLFVVSIFLIASPASAQKRVALVIGNSAYKSAPQLTNPANDAALVGGMFKSAGFESVDVALDLGVAGMRKALRDFGAKSRYADVAVIYYAGHGIELDGTNYLIPIDATLETDSDVLDETLPLDRALFAVEPAKQLRLVILDACRDNPFAKTMKRTMASRAIGRGLAKVEPTSPNTMIAYAAKAGSTAADGDSRNSPFAISLVERLPTPGLDLRKAFGFVRDDVLKATGNKQEPYVYGSLGGNDVPLVAEKQIAPTQPQGDPLASVRRDYELALQIGTQEVWVEFLKQFPDGFYAGLAKAQLNKIAAEDTRVAATEKARLAAEDKERLAAEGARKTEQARAEAQAKAAEAARIAAEKTKAIEQAKAAEAEAKRAAAEKAAANKLAVEQAAKDKLADDGAATEQKVAALPSAPEADAPPLPFPSQTEIAKSIQIELSRVGCHTGKIDNDWSAAARRSLEKFNKRAGLKLDVRLASIDALDAIKGKLSRICPLECEHGFRASSERCVRIVCPTSSFVNDDNECERKREKPIAISPERRSNSSATSVEQKPKLQQSSGQTYCDQGGCRALAKGCRLDERKGWSGNQFTHVTCN